MKTDMLAAMPQHEPEIIEANAKSTRRGALEWTLIGLALLAGLTYIALQLWWMVGMFR